MDNNNNYNNRGFFTRIQTFPWTNFLIILLFYGYGLIVITSHIYFLVSINYVFRYCSLSLIWVFLSILTILNFITVLLYAVYPMNKIFGRDGKSIIRERKLKLKKWRSREDRKRSLYIPVDDLEIPETSGQRKRKKTEFEWKKCFKWTGIMAASFCSLFVNLVVFILAGVTLYLQTSGIFQIEGVYTVPANYQSTVNNTIRVFREQGGQVHVEAKTDLDALFGMGFVHAQDRFSQMEVSRKAAMGEVSEIIGKEGLNFDFDSRHMNFRNAAQEIYLALPRKYQRELEVYSNGINSYLRNSRTRIIPLELKFVGYTSFSEIKEWKPEHSVMIDLFRHFKMSENHHYEYLRLKYIIDGFSEEEINKFLPDYDSNGGGYPIIIETGNKNKNKKFSRETDAFKKPFNDIKKEHEDLLFDLINEKDHKESNEVNENCFGFRFCKISKWIGNLMFELGKMYVKNILNSFKIPKSELHSNSWIINGNATLTGYPYLCNDPHGRLHFTNSWYQIHLHGDNLDVTGGSIPGLPFVIVGRNSKIGWGITSSMADVVDIYIYEQNKEKTKYKYKENWYDYEIRTEEINIKGRKEPVSFDFKWTQLGEAIFYDIQPDNRTGVFRWSTLFRSRGKNYTNTGFITTSLINRANDWSDFKTALYDYWDYSPTNYLYGDTDGNIGLISAGKFPIRNHTGRFPVDGSSGNWNWKGFLSKEKWVSSFNPAEGVIITANNRIHDGDYRFSYDYSTGIRGKRIKEFLNIEEFTNFNETKMADLQYDVKSQLFLEFKRIKFFRNLLESGLIMKKEVKKKITNLANFNGEFSSKDENIGIFETWFQSFRKYIPPLYNGFGYDRFAPFILKTLEDNVLSSNNCPFVSGLKFNITHNCSYLAYKIFQDILKNPNNLRMPLWDQIHTIHLNHDYFGENEIGILGCLYNKRFNANGDAETVDTFSPTPHKTDFTIYNAKFTSGEGAVYRQIIDFSNMDNSKFIFPMGQSSELYSLFLDNYMEKWNGKKYLFLKTEKYFPAYVMYIEK